MDTERKQARLYRVVHLYIPKVEESMDDADFMAAWCQSLIEEGRDYCRELGEAIRSGTREDVEGLGERVERRLENIRVWQDRPESDRVRKGLSEEADLWGKLSSLTNTRQPDYARTQVENLARAGGASPSIQGDRLRSLRNEAYELTAELRELGAERDYDSIRRAYEEGF